MHNWAVGAYIFFYLVMIVLFFQLILYYLFKFKLWFMIGAFFNGYAKFRNVPLVVLVGDTTISLNVVKAESLLKSIDSIKVIVFLCNQSNYLCKFHGIIGNNFFNYLIVQIL